MLLSNAPLWVPLPGPQTEAYESLADIVFYGGAAGGGKTDLAVGLGLTAHRKSIIFRKEGTQLQGIIDRMTEIMQGRDGYNGQERIWRLVGRQIEFGSCPNLGDETKYQGRPHDLVVFDEITHFLLHQFLFLCGWLRTDKPNQRCRVVCTGNPPTDSNGQWVVSFFAPWLDKNHPNPAKPGELRFFSIIDGKDTELADGKPFYHNGELITPKSRTFIPSRVQDNPFLMSTNYTATLQALPEPLRSQMLKGDFTAGTDDDPYQVIPTDWVTKAQDRWSEEGKKGPMDSVGCDVARGGKDETVIAPRYGNWFAKLLCYPGSSTPDGPTVASLVVSAMRDAAPIQLDVIGVGTSVFDHLNGNNIQVEGINGAASSNDTDKTGKLRFRNLRAQLWWKLREALDPNDGDSIALPPGSDLKADLTAPRWKLTTQGIQIESKDELMKRIGRSPDKGDAIVYGLVSTPKRDEDSGFKLSDLSGSWMGV